MNRKSQFRVSAVVIVIAVIFIAIMTISRAGKQSVDLSAAVTVKGGLITEGQSQTSYLPAPGKKCTFEVTVSGQKEITSAAQLYKDAAMKESLATLDLTGGSAKTESLEVDGDGVYLLLARSIAADAGAALADGTYKVTYAVKVVGEGGSGTLILMLLLIAVVTVAFLWMLSYETGKEATYSKKRIRMRGKAFMHAFFVLTMMILTFALLDGVSDQFPFTTYQAGLISVIVAATVFVILADRLDAYLGFSERRGQIIAMLSAVVLVNMIVVLIQAFSNKSSGSKLGNWIVNLVTAVAFFVMVIALLTKKKTASSGRRRSSTRSSAPKRKAAPVSDDVELYDAPTNYDPYDDSGYGSYSGAGSIEENIDDIDF